MTQCVEEMCQMVGTYEGLRWNDRTDRWEPVEDAPDEDEAPA